MSLLSILLMHLVNSTQFLSVTPLSLSCARFVASSFPVAVIVMVPFTTMYASALSHKLYLNVLNLIVVLNLISLPVYVPLDLSFISTQFLVLN